MCFDVGFCCFGLLLCWVFYCLECVFIRLIWLLFWFVGLWVILLFWFVGLCGCCLVFTCFRLLLMINLFYVLTVCLLVCGVGVDCCVRLLTCLLWLVVCFVWLVGCLLFGFCLLIWVVCMLILFDCLFGYV